MAVSKLTLCNRALARIGQATAIADFDVDVARGMKSAVACDLIFTDTLKEAARGGDWNFLRARAEVTGDYATAYATYIAAHPGDTAGAIAAGDAAVALITGGFGWARSYLLPTTCVRLIQFNGMDVYNDGGIEGLFEISGRYILADDETCQIRYTQVLTTWTTPTEANWYAQFDPMFADAVVVLLASKLAETLRADSALGQSFRQEYEQLARAQARQKNANERRRGLMPQYLDSASVRSRGTSTMG
jgi:hypothetical protein